MKNLFEFIGLGFLALYFIIPLILVRGLTLGWGGWGLVIKKYPTWGLRLFYIFAAGLFVLMIRILFDHS